MIVRGWLIVGGDGGLPPQQYVGDYHDLPNAGNFKIGQWLLWRQMPGRRDVVLVCVELPL